MTDNEKQIIWDYIIELALKCASQSDKNPFNVVETMKKAVKTPDILK